MDFIKYIDFFSIKFHFYTNNQPNYQNIFGGIMTLIYVLVCIGIFIGYSYDDFSRLNPITTISEIPDSESKLVNIKKEKIWIPFRIITEQNKFYDHRGIFIFLPYLVEGEYNEEIGINLKYHLLSYKLCNETSMANKSDSYKIGVPLNELFCIDQNDITFGGNWNEDFIKYIEINLYLCKNDINFNSSDSRCTKIDIKNKNINNFSIDFYYPVVKFQPSNIKTPMVIIYKNYICRLSSYSYKIEKLYIQEHILSDDKSFLKSNYKNSSSWGISSLYGNDYFLPNENNFINNNNTSKIYSLNIYMDNGYVYYTRTYKKIILIISNVFPLFKLVLYFIKKLTQHVKMSLIKRNLAGLIFVKKDTKLKIFFQNQIENLNKKNNKFIYLSNNNKILNNNLEGNHLNELNNDIKINNMFKKKKYNENEISKSNIGLNNENQIKILNTRQISSSNQKSLILLTNELNNKEPPKNKKTIAKSKKPDYIFSYYYFFLDIIFDKLIRPQKFFCVSKAYFTVYNFMCQIYDISTHIILFKQFNSLYNIMMEKFYEEKGMCPSKPYNKININDSKTLEKLNKDLKKNKSIIFSNNLL